MQEINIQIFHYFNGFSTTGFGEIFVQIFVDSPIFILPLFLSGYWLYYTIKGQAHRSAPTEKGVGVNLCVHPQKNNLLFIFYGTVLALSLSLIIQQFVSVDRPEEHLQSGAKLLLDHLPDASFPSDHATVSIAFLSGLFFAGYKKWGLFLLLPFIFMNIARVIAGVHWPFDIVAGSIVGITGGYLVFAHISQNKVVKMLNSKIIAILQFIKL